MGWGRRGGGMGGGGRSSARDGGWVKHIVRRL